MPKDYLSPREVTELYPWTEKTLRSWRSKKVGPRYIKTEGRVFYRVRDIEDYIEASVVDTYDSAPLK